MQVSAVAEASARDRKVVRFMGEGLRGGNNSGTVSGDAAAAANREYDRNSIRFCRRRRSGYC
jgi:hypothetical protein